jgi:hypothetical protein
MNTEPSDVQEINRRRKQMKRSGLWKWVRRLFLAAVSLLVLGTLAATVAWYTVRNKGIARRDAIVAGLDTTDPNWRIHDLTTARNATLPPDDQNAAVQALAAAKLIPKSFDEWAKEEKWRSELKLPHLPHPDEIKEARGVLAECEAAVRQARTVRQYPSGGFPIVHNEPDVLSTPLPNTQEMRRVAFLLELDVLLSSHDEKGNDALDSCLAILATARGLGDEPATISTLVRMAVAGIAVRATERTLAWTTADEGKMAVAQAAFAAEADVPRLKFALRGDRAMMYRVMENIDAGRLTLTQIIGNPGGPTLMERVGTVPLRATLPEQQSLLLELMNQGLAAADGPHHERDEVFDDIEVRLRKAKVRDPYRHLLVVLLMPAVSKVSYAENRVVAHLRCATVALACERYRLKSGHFPESLGDLPKGMLAEVPTDPFTGKLLLYTRADEGAVVYCTGLDRTDDGGENLDPKATQGGDIGFRLFDVKHRRQPPLPKPAAEPDGNQP